MGERMEGEKTQDMAVSLGVLGVAEGRTCYS